AVAGDDVAFGGVVDAVAVGADDVVLGAEDNGDAADVVAQGGSAVFVCADVIALDEVVIAAAIADRDAVAAERTGNDVPRRGSAAADRVLVGALIHAHAAGAVADGDRAGVIGADVVACNDVSGSGAAAQDDARVGVAADHVAFEDIAGAVGVGAD